MGRFTVRKKDSLRDGEVTGLEDGLHKLTEGKEGKRERKRRERRRREGGRPDNHCTRMRACVRACMLLLKREKQVELLH